MWKDHERTIRVPQRPTKRSNTVESTETRYLHLTNLTMTETYWEAAHPPVEDVIWNPAEIKKPKDRRDFTVRMRTAVREHNMPE